MTGAAATGMAANDESATTGGARGLCLSPADLAERLEEEVGRAERHGTGLSCLVLVIDELHEIAREHGSSLPEQTVGYLAGALARELRRYDRVGRAGEGELVVVLPGADGPRAEIVARRVLERVEPIKIESSGERRPLKVSLGLASWSERMGAGEMLKRARAAASRRNGNGEDPPGRGPAWRAAGGGGPPPGAHRADEQPPAPS